MTRIPVTSTLLKSVGWDVINGIGVLEIEFVNGHIYHYPDVPGWLYTALLETESNGGSAGKYFIANIKGKYPFERVYKTSDPDSITSPKNQLIILADALDKAERQGAMQDAPESSRYIVMSDTVAKRMSETLRSVADQLGTISNETDPTN